MSQKLIISGIVAVLLVGGGVLLMGQGGESLQQEQNAPQQAQAKLPRLTFTDYEGNPAALADFQGRPLVLNAWAVWCPFCVKELGEFVSLQKEFPEVLVIAIDRAEPLQTAKSYTDDLGLTQELVFLLDPSDSFYRTIGGFTMPETLFVDRQGVIQDHKRGPMDLKEMRQRIQKIL